jgi:hypothetical protein
MTTTMTTDVDAPPQTAGPPSRLTAWGRSLSDGLAWARDAQRRCNRAAAAGRRLDHDALRQIVADIDASRPDR